MTDREIEFVSAGQPASDGAGVRLVRLLGDRLQRRLDPFLMLDAFGSDNPDDYIAGFPEHPHRGFETITYMLAGNMAHEDSRGNKGLLGPGDLQWMTAGRGILHSEMPAQVDGRMAGFQLWLNLAAADKMSHPAYQDIAAQNIPVVPVSSLATARVLAGEFECTDATGETIASGQGAVQRAVTEPRCFDLTFHQAGTLRVVLPANHNAFVVPVQGGVRVGSASETLTADSMTDTLAILGPGDGVPLHGEAGSRVLLISGKPLHEPIVQYGPFVMNTRDEILQAIDDMRHGRLA